jgi:hypothetical protein
MKKINFFILSLVLLVSVINAQDLILGGFGTISPNGAAVFGGLSGSKTTITTSYYGHDIGSLDLTINKFQLMFSIGGRTAVKNRDETFDFISVIFTPELHSSGDWILLGLVGINFNIGPYVPKEIKKQPLFGLSLVKIL